MRITRGCGHRKIGGLYLVGTGIPAHCGKLPVELPQTCQCCGAGIKMGRGLQFIQTKLLLMAEGLCGAQHCKGCPLGGAAVPKVGLMWVGGAHYSPAEFMAEAYLHGVSKRIAQVPKQLVIGKSWVLLAHKEAFSKLTQPADCTCKESQIFEHVETRPGVFYAFQPTRVEMPLDKASMLTRNGIAPHHHDEVKRLLERGITPVFVEMDEFGEAIEDSEDDQTIAMPGEGDGVRVVTLPRMMGERA